MENKNINEKAKNSNDTNLNEFLNTQENIKKLWNNILAQVKNAKCAGNKKKYTILLPPPNITGSLHIGHFLNWSIQDMLMRKAYIDGFDPNWIAGIDHAGIATQFVVERELAKEGISRHEIGRTEFTKKIWEWKNKAENLISEQALSFGFFFDWENKRFTMDEEYQKHVIKAFIKLFNEGLIKKSERITNWDVNFQTALSDLEVIEKTEKRSMYIITYYASDYAQTGHKLEIGTTRPETMFADAAVCVHPDDKRFKHLHGKTFVIPLINKEIPLILDTACSMEKGTGALKITPAHDAADNATGMRHKLEFVQIIDKNGCMFGDSTYLPEKYVGKTTTKAREMVIADLAESGHLVETRDWEGIVYYPEKTPANESPKPIETIMTQQWFLDVSKMAKQALEQSSEVEFIPDNIKNTFEHWMNNIQPWCISRQIWWGHRLPIWYTKDGQTICAHDEEEAIALAGTNELTQETDVLDTWFSSALWPIATQESSKQETAIQSEATKHFSKTDMLVTGKDILFFWVARMIMFTLYFKNQMPFKRVYFNAIVRDKQRQKMSKTKGNVLNPLDIKEEYGNDALRFALLKKASWGKDIIIETKDIEDGRAFSTKIRNATKFVTTFMSKEYKASTMLDSWMESKISDAKQKIAKSIDECAFHEACKKLYDLFWNNFCAWYIEGCKLAPSPRAIEFLCSILKIAHPIIPWTSEECFQDIQKSNTQKSNCENSIMNYEHAAYQIHETNNFDQIIEITRLLRKLAFVGECKEFNIEIKKEATEFIKFYSKLALNENLDFSFNIYGTKIFINKECAKIAKNSIEKELKESENEYTTLCKRIQKANNVPDEVLNEWKERQQNLQKQTKTLKELVDKL